MGKMHMTHTGTIIKHLVPATKLSFRMSVIGRVE